MRITLEGNMNNIALVYLKPFLKTNVKQHCHLSVSPKAVSKQSLLGNYDGGSGGGSGFITI